MKKYLSKLSDSISDEHNVFVELMLAWIAVVLTLLLVFAVISVVFA